MAVSVPGAEGDLPKGYLLKLTYAGGKVEVVEFDSLKTKDVYSGTVRKGEGAEVPFSSKLVAHVLCLDAALYEDVSLRLGAGAGGTFLKDKLLLVDVAGSPRSSAEDLVAQKQKLYKILEANGLLARFAKVREALDAAIARGQEAGTRQAKLEEAAKAPPAGAFSFTTTGGTRHEDVSVISVTVDELKISTSAGISRVPLGQIPEGAAEFPEPWKGSILALKKAAALKPKEPAPEPEKLEEITGSGEFYVSETTKAPRLPKGPYLLLESVSDIYLQGGVERDPGPELRAPVHEMYANDPDPRLAEIATNALEYVEILKLKETVPATNAAALEEGGKQWRKFLTESTYEAVVRAMNDQQGTSDNEIGRAMAYSEALAKAPQMAAIWSRSLEVADCERRLAMRRAVTGLMESTDKGRPAGSVMEIGLKGERGAIRMSITNRHAKTLHHCVITTRREQDHATINEWNRDRAIAGGLNMLLGMSDEGNARNDLQFKLAMDIAKGEFGSVVYVPEIQPGETIVIDAAPLMYIEYSNALYVSLWCDEGREVDRSADVKGLLKRLEAGL